MEFITTKEASARWGISPTRITVLANEGRIPGAQRVGRSWLIPASAQKPAERKGGRGRSQEAQTDDFYFPLYFFRPDWTGAKENALSDQQHKVLEAERAVMECRFTEVLPILEDVLHAPDDIYTEIGALWCCAISSIALSRLNDFSRSYLRLQTLLRRDIPHREDLELVLDFLQTYVEALCTISAGKACSIRVHAQCLPSVCALMGYTQMTREVTKPGSAEVAMLELLLRFLETTSSQFTVELMHLFLMNIYSFRQNTELSQEHAEAAVRIAYDSGICYPLVTYYGYNVPVFSPILDRYPTEFQNRCRELSGQYLKNYAAMLSQANEDNVLSRLTGADYPYVFAVLANYSNGEIAKIQGVSQQTVRRKLDKLCEKLGLMSKKELQNYLLKFM